MASNNLFTVSFSGSQQGVFTFCYNVSGCQGWCDEATVYVIVRQDIVESDCIAPNCNLACFGNFEEFIPGYLSYWPQISLDYFGLGSFIPNLPSIVKEIENGNNALNIQSYPGGQDAVIIPLNSIIENGCTIDINFDAVSSQFGPSIPSLEFYGLTAYLPAIGNTAPTCQPNPFQISPGIDAVCIGVVPIIPPDTDVQFNLFTGEASNLDFLPYGAQWINSSGFSIDHILVVPSWIGLNPSERSIIHLDNLTIKNSCLPELSISPTVQGQCIGEQIGISYEICIEGSQNVPALIELHATLPLIPGVVIANNGDFDLNGDATFSLTPLPNGIPICTTLTLFLDIAPNVHPGTQVSISIEETAQNVCVDYNPETLITLEDCNPIFSCNCPETGQLNIDATSNSPQFDPNLDGVLWSQYALANNLPDILDGSIHHGCIAIAGRLIIDRNVEISSCSNVRMQPCSEIWVGTGESSSPYPSLLLYLNNLYGCEQMWKGITVNPFCMLTMGKNSIEDAQFAVTALGSNLFQPPASPPTRFYASTNFFRNNHVGVYIPTNKKQSVLHAPFQHNNFIGKVPGRDLLPPCDATLPNHSTQMGYAGVVTLGTAFDVGTTGSSGYVNTFRDIRNGVIAENDAWVNVYRARFNNVPGYMGINGNPSFAASSGVGVLFRRGICSVKNSRFEGVGHAVFANNTTGLSVLQNQMPDVFTGVQAIAPRGFNINENQSISFRDWGIFTRNPSQLLPLSSELLIEDNHLHSIEDDADGVIEEAGITVVLSNNISNTEDARIAGNRLTTRDLQFGILMNTVNNWLLDDNRITIEPLLTNLPHTGTGGITLFSAENNWLYGNTVTDNGTDPSVGIWAASARSNTYCCNTTSFTNWGIYFQGSCDNTTLRETFIDGNDDFSLECTPGTIISDQPNIFLSPGDNHSNQFHIGSNAQHGGDDGQVQNSEFFVRTNVPLDHPENVFLPNIPGGYDPANPKWFFASGFANKDRNAAGGCPPPDYGEPRNRDRELSETDAYFASGGFLGSPYGAALNWEGKLRLYKRMQKYPELAGQSATVDAFYTNAGNNLVGKYAAVDGAIASINTLPQPWQVAIQNAQGALQTAISTADSQLAALASVSTWEDSTAIYRTAEQTRILALPAYESLMQYLNLADSLRNTKAQAAWLINQALPSTDILQSNRKTVNRVYLETIAQGITTLTPAQYADIAPIAWQCPLEGGGVVYTARSLYQLHTAANFDDRLLCGLSNQERGAQRANAPPTEALKVQPNPSSDELLVTLPDSVLIEDLMLKVININGMEVFSKQVSGETTMLIDVTKLPAGLYTLFASGKSTIPAPVKFVVQH